MDELSCLHALSPSEDEGVLFPPHFAEHDPEQRRASAKRLREALELLLLRRVRLQLMTLQLHLSQDPQAGCQGAQRAYVERLAIPSMGGAHIRMEPEPGALAFYTPADIPLRGEPTGLLGRWRCRS